MSTRLTKPRPKTRTRLEDVGGDPDSGTRSEEIDEKGSGQDQDQQESTTTVFDWSTWRD